MSGFEKIVGAAKEVAKEVWKEVAKEVWKEVVKEVFYLWVCTCVCVYIWILFMERTFSGSDFFRIGLFPERTFSGAVFFRIGLFPDRTFSGAVFSLITFLCSHSICMYTLAEKTESNSAHLPQ